MIQGSTLLSRLVAAALLIAGAVHLALVPGHVQDVPVHGAVMAFTGVFEVGWGLLFLWRPSIDLANGGVVLGAWAISLWVLTRVLPAPFGHGPEAVDPEGILVKLLEIGAILGLLVIARPRPPVLWMARPLGLVVLGLLVGALTYSAGVAAEQVTPPGATQGSHGESAGHGHGG